MIAEPPTIQLPLATGPGAEPDRLRVLCVDDYRDSADTLSVLLEIYGCETRVCYTGRTAIAAAATFRPDACLIDLNMPGMDGDEVARRIRSLFPDAPPILIAVTAQGDAESRARTTAAGFDMHLVKPVDPDELATTVADLGIMTRWSRPPG